MHRDFSYYTKVGLVVCLVLAVIVKAVVRFLLPVGQDENISAIFPHFHVVSLIFLKFSLFSSSLWSPGWAARPLWKALATTLVIVAASSAVVARATRCQNEHLRIHRSLWLNVTAPMTTSVISSIRSKSRFIPCISRPYGRGRSVMGVGLPMFLHWPTQRTKFRTYSDLPTRCEEFTIPS